ncbi:MAG: CPBP family intramembrane metalloprotease [Planctomycetota bacterium]|nr:MAG: CPBP family intramembrane metalloprotease [Planctomycetota bacterium]REK19912.1 MAG: CPBP family intramembrane metalloprotease [Planctomycetota bacterium]REK27477.1 MAG: CPBP family intramembrane metalloprotease [Planctomycetota bacterium]
MSDSSPLVDLDDILIEEPDSLDEQGVDPERLAARPPGPGLPESIGWLVLVFLAQLGAGLVVMAAYTVFLAVSGVPLRAFEAEIESLNPTVTLWLFGGPNLFAFLFIIGVGLIRLRPSPVRQLNLSSPSVTQFLIFSTAVLPLGLIADALWQPGVDLWEQIVEKFPLLQLLDQSNVIEFMETIHGANLPSLLLLVAVVPAIGEEFVFRGLIGRGLVARWGVFAGVAFTSVMFAAMHMYPPHVWAILPVGIMMHIVYLSTRSFWAPVVFHFINNSLASIYTAYGLTESDVVDQPAAWLLIAAPIYVIVCCALLWRYRTRYVDEEGQEVSPGYYTAAPPDTMGPTRRQTVRSIPVIIVMGLILAAEIGTVVHDLISASAPVVDEIEDASGGQ